MLYHEAKLAHGERLFRWRSFLPLAFLPVLLVQAWLRAPEEAPTTAWSLVCLAVALAGLAVRVAAIGCTAPGTSGRNTGQGQVADALNTTGLYSLCRHPLYVGNYLMLLGPVLLVGTPGTLALFTLCFWMCYGRIVLVEERFLAAKYGEAYRDYAARVPVFLPRLSGWTPPGRGFSTCRILRRGAPAARAARRLALAGRRQPGAVPRAAPGRQAHALAARPPRRAPRRGVGAPRGSDPPRRRRGARPDAPDPFT